MWKRCCSHKWTRRLAALLAVGMSLACLAGCQGETAVEQMPYVEPQAPPARNDVRASLYFLQQEDGDVFVSEVRQMQVPATQTPERGAAVGGAGTGYRVYRSDRFGRE